MTHNAQRVYFGRDSLRTAGELIAFWNPAVCERIARHQVKMYAFGASPTNAALIAFWAGVLAQSRSLVVAPDEAERMRNDLSPGRRAAFLSLERRSRPQVTGLP